MPVRCDRPRKRIAHQRRLYAGGEIKMNEPCRDGVPGILERRANPDHESGPIRRLRHDGPNEVPYFCGDQLFTLGT